MEPKILSQKLDIILNKLKNDISKVNGEKLQQVLHSVHTVSWIVIQSIVPYIQEEFRGQTIKVFQMLTQLIKSLKDTEFEEVSLKLFQLKSQRRRSLKLINCSVCDQYRKLPSKQNEKSYYANYINQLKKESQLQKEQKAQFNTVMNVNDIKEQKQLNAATQINFDEKQLENIEIQTDFEEIDRQNIIKMQQDIQLVQNSLKQEEYDEFKDLLMNYYNIVEQHKNLQQIIQDGHKQCDIQGQLIKSINNDIPLQQLKYQSCQSIQLIDEQLLKKQRQIQVITNFKSKQFQSVNPQEIQQLVQQLIHQQQAIEMGIIEYDKDYDPSLLPEGYKIIYKISIVDGINMIEEVVIDEKTGEIIRSRIRKRASIHEFQEEQEGLIQILKSKEQNLDEDNKWIISKYGDRVKVIQKQQSFTQYQVSEEQNKKKLIKISNNSDGMKTIEEEWETIQKDGQHQHRVYQSRGSLVYEDNGTDMAKRWSTKDLQKTEVIFEELVTKDGIITKVLEKEKYGQDIIRIIKKDNTNNIVSQIVKQVLKDEQGQLYQQEDEHKDDGQKITRKVYCQGNDEYQKITEVTHLPNGIRKSVLIKKFQDKIETNYVDEYGDEIQTTKYSYINEKGIQVQCERQINMRTKEETLQKKFKGLDGKMTIENITTLDGVEISKQIIVFINDKERIERVTKNNKTIESKIIIDANGNEQIQQLDPDENIKIHTTSFKKDNVEYSQQTINLPNGAKRSIQQRVYLDQNQDKIVEEERIDEFGQKTVVKKRINVLGEEIVEEFNIHESEEQLELKKLRHTEKRLPRKDTYIEVHDEAIQCDLGDKNASQESFQLKRVQQQQQPVIITTQPDFNDIDQQAFKKLQSIKSKQDPQFQEAMLLIKKYFNKNENEEIQQEEFNEYMSKLRANHQRSCGEQCSHLLRFYAKLGFLIQKSSFNRQVYKMQKVQLQAKE